MDLKSLTSLSKNQMLKIIGGSGGGSACGIAVECGINNPCRSDDCNCEKQGTTSYCFCKPNIPSC